LYSWEIAVVVVRVQRLLGRMVVEAADNYCLELSRHRFRHREMLPILVVDPVVAQQAQSRAPSQQGGAWREG
jgi:hypothetical protein